MLSLANCASGTSSSGGGLEVRAVQNPQGAQHGLIKECTLSDVGIPISFKIYS